MKWMIPLLISFFASMSFAAPVELPHEVSENNQQEILEELKFIPDLKDEEFLSGDMELVDPELERDEIFQPRSGETKVSKAKEETKAPATTKK